MPVSWLKNTAFETETQRMRGAVVAGRIKGWTYERCATELGISVPWACKLYKQAMRQIVEPAVVEMRQLELSRLDGMVEECYNILNAEVHLVSGGKVVRDFMTDDNGAIVVDDDNAPKLMRLRDYNIKLNAMDRLLKISERRCRILGIDAPTKTALTDPTGQKEAELVQVYLPSNGRDSAPDSPD